MDDAELLSQTEHVSEIFTRIMLKTMSAGPAEEITLAQFHALKHVALHGSCTIGSIAEGLSISQPAATMLVDRIAKRGLVERRTGRNDRRQAEILLTRHAQDLLQEIESERANRLRRILELMAPRKRRRFVESLESFVAAALKLEESVDEACLHCGIEHQPDCIVNQTKLALAGRDIERT